MINNNIKKPILLCILDGFGIEESSQKKPQNISQENSNLANAIALAKMPNYQRFLKIYPHSQLQTSGNFVGLPDGQIGNSKVGHMTIGAGRIIYQDLPRINNSINDKTFENNFDLLDLIAKFKNTNKTCHLVGLRCCR